MVALDAHDASRGDSQVRRAEVAHADEVGRDERVLERDEDVEGGLRVGEHLGGVVEGGEGRGLAGHAFLEQVVGHLLLAGLLEIALVVGRQT